MQNNDKSFLDAAKAKLQKIIDEQDLDALLEAVPTIAQLSQEEFLPFIPEIKKAFAKDLPWREFNAAITAVRNNNTKKSQLDPDEVCQIAYVVDGPGFICYQANKDPLLLSNFSAKILEDVRTDDGAECLRSYKIEATLQGQTTVFDVPARDYGRCEWIDEHLGATSWVVASPLAKAHVANAVKANSEPIEIFNYAHTGWRNIKGRMYYLHAQGGVSQVSHVENSDIDHLTQTNIFSEPACGVLSQTLTKTMSQVSQVSQLEKGIYVKLSGELENYKLTQGSLSEIEAVRASLRLFDIVADEVSFPLFSAVWRAPLGHIDFGVHLSGQTGWGKTELAALAQQHFGTAMHAKALPGSWGSTENSLEMLLFQGKDALVVVDDFKPKGSKSDQERLHAKADGVFRRIGNGAARGRLSKDLTQRTTRTARCMLVSTGEDVPRGESLRARAVCLEMPERITQRGTDAQRRLSAAQKDATSGVYTTAMHGYLAWLSPRIEAIQACLRDLVDIECENVPTQGHARTTTNVASLTVGLRFFLQYACEIGAISIAEAQTYIRRCLTSFGGVTRVAAEENAHDKASEQWRRWVVAALETKQAHLLSMDGANPGMQYGWVSSDRGGGMPIGWVDGNDVYLLPDATYVAALEMSTRAGDPLVTTERTLRKFLRSDGLLATTGLSTEKRTVITVRKRIRSAGQKDVLHLKLNKLFLYGMGVPELDSPDSVDSKGREPAPEADGDVSHVDAKKLSESRKIESTTDSPTQKPPESCLPESFCADILQKISRRAVSQDATGSDLHDELVFLDGDEESDDALDRALEEE